MMNYKEFKRAAILEDARNVFGCSLGVNGIPVSICEFYANFNPIDVEVTYPDLGAVRFYPIEKCEEIKKDYELEKEDFVFATCNGDPIFLKNNQVYISLPEVYSPELLATSFEMFLDMYIKYRYDK